MTSEFSAAALTAGAVFALPGDLPVAKDLPNSTGVEARRMISGPFQERLKYYENHLELQWLQWLLNLLAINVALICWTLVVRLFRFSSTRQLQHCSIDFKKICTSMARYTQPVDFKGSNF